MTIIRLRREFFPKIEILLRTEARDFNCRLCIETISFETKGASPRDIHLALNSGFFEPELGRLDPDIVDNFLRETTGDKGYKKMRIFKNCHECDTEDGSCHRCQEVFAVKYHPFAR